MKEVLTLVKSLRARLRHRTDSEHEQAVLRIVIVGLVLAYMGTIYSPGADDSRHTQLILLSVLAADLVFAFALFAAICIWPRENVSRRYAGMLADAGTATIVVLLTGEAGVSMVGVYLFITFGNGFRYGRRYLFACQALCLAGFMAALLFTAYWQKHQVAGWSLFIALVVLPLYVSTLLTRIQEARTKAEEANRAKSSFLANMSHEMRTPLNGIVGVVELFNVTRLDQQQVELVRLLRHSVGVLRSLVDDVLDISKIEAGRLSIEVVDFDLHTMLNTLVNLLRPHAAAKGLQFRAMVDPSIEYHLSGDLHHLRQVLLNLLSNAIKFTHAGEVVVSVSLVRETDYGVQLRFEVRDTGIGMNPAVQSKIFQRFVQADESTTRRYGGTGLGTTIAKQLVELMSGTIGVTSELGRGSTFWFELPLTKAAPALAPATADNADVAPALVLADATASAYLLPVIESACGRAEVFSTSAALLTALTTLQQRGARVPAVIACGDANTARDLFNTVSANTPNESIALIHLASDRAQELVADRTRGSGDGRNISTIPMGTPPKLLRNAIHAVAAQESEGAQIIDLSQILAEQRVGRRILVAEDNATNRTIISQLLETAGHTVILACDGEEALDRHEDSEPDLAILDFNMPQRNGLDVTRAIRAMEGSAERMPVMILSASVTPEARDAAKKAGADEFLGKPYEAVALLQAIDRLGRRMTKPIFRTHEPAPLDLARRNAPLLDYARIADVERITREDTFITKLVDGFHGDVAQVLARLETALEQRSSEALAEGVHAMLGAAKSIGAAQLAVMCEDFERRAGRIKDEETRALLADMHKCFEETDLALRAHLSSKKRAAS